MEYENALGIFSPDGRLIQVEYAQQASEQGSLVVFSSDTNEICLSIETKTHNKMLIDQNKLLPVDKDLNIWYTFSGIKPDSYKVLNEARLICRNYKIKTGTNISFDELAYELSLYKQKFTLDSSMRPFGIRSILLQVKDMAKIYVLEPDGNYSEYKCGAVGQKSVSVCEYLEKCEEEDIIFRSVSGLGTVVQSDKNKVMSYVISKDEIRRVEDETVSQIISTVSVK
uniref:Proteasome subunit alpha type-4 n=1 Tax=Vairimorpha necatrix TaxID=6039 RepID=UPI002249A320|nr:Chain C, Proteasome subunit alpha type-4 [Vairimorpha necatrix]8ADN_Q Chain Q, Proteasome subunit alpha type-4 [Vairimorpha necatrix]